MTDYWTVSAWERVDERPKSKAPAKRLCSEAGGDVTLRDLVRVARLFGRQVDIKLVDPAERSQGRP